MLLLLICALIVIGVIWFSLKKYGYFGSPEKKLDQDKLDKLEQIFKMCDVDGDGEVTLKELIDVCKSSRWVASFFGQWCENDEKASTEKLELLFKMIDVNDDRALTYEEFQAFYKAEKRLETAFNEKGAAALMFEQELLADEHIDTTMLEQEINDRVKQEEEILKAAKEQMAIQKVTRSPSDKVQKSTEEDGPEEAEEEEEEEEKEDNVKEFDEHRDEMSVEEAPIDDSGETKLKWRIHPSKLGAWAHVWSLKWLGLEKSIENMSEWRDRKKNYGEKKCIVMFSDRGVQKRYETLNIAIERLSNIHAARNRTFRTFTIQLNGKTIIESPLLQRTPDKKCG